MAEGKESMSKRADKQKLADVTAEKQRLDEQAPIFRQLGNAQRAEEIERRSKELGENIEKLRKKIDDGGTPRDRRTPMKVEMSDTNEGEENIRKSIRELEENAEKINKKVEDILERTSKEDRDLSPEEEREWELLDYELDTIEEKIEGLEEELDKRVLDSE